MNGSALAAQEPVRTSAHRAGRFDPVLLFCGLLIGGFALASLSERPLLAIDETRYATVAWEMWVRNDFLVPHLNGAVYSHKPPLLFWLIHIGWKAFGVSEAWPRLISPFISFFNLLLLSRLARSLWPERPSVSRFAPVILISLPLWVLFSSVLTFEMLLTFFTSLTLLGWAVAWKENRPFGLLWAALGIGGGILAKGPVILLHTVPLLFFEHFWMARERATKSIVSLSLIAILAGAFLALLWALPAGITGGPEYREQIFHGQTAGRVLNSFAHKQPWWWYLPLLPILVLPWLFSTPVWNVLGRAKLDAGLSFCLAWFGSALLGFSLVSGKQIYYLLPDLPALALILTRALTDCSPVRLRLALRANAAVWLLLGFLLMLIPWVGPSFQKFPTWLAGLSPAWGAAAAVGAAAGLLALRPRKVSDRPPERTLARTLAVAPLLAVIWLAAALFGVFGSARAFFDLSEVSRRIAALQEEHSAVAVVGNYHGQFNFIGRLKQPLEELPSPEDALSWAQLHPAGMLVVNCNASAVLPSSPAFVQYHRRRRLALLPSSAVAAAPELFKAALR